MKYENKKTKQRAEVVSEDEYSVTLTDVETGETQSITHAEFKKDWKKLGKRRRPRKRARSRKFTLRMKKPRPKRYDRRRIC